VATQPIQITVTCLPRPVVQAAQLSRARKSCLQGSRVVGTLGAVSATVAFDVGSLLDAGAAHLQQMLGPDYEIGPYHVAGAPQEPVLISEDVFVDRLVSIRDIATGQFGVVLLEAKRDLKPVDARTQLAPRVRLMRQLMGDSASVLVISPWVSPRTREVLDEAGFGYLDFEGNVSFRLRRPVILLRKSGSAHNPNPTKRTQGSIRGALAGRLARVLVDVQPPYRASELASVSNVSVAWASRVLDSLESQALIRRVGQVIVEVDWAGLLRARAAAVNLLKTNTTVPLVALAGVAQTLERLAEPENADNVAVTGSVAAQAVAPVAIGGQLMLYVRGGPREPQLLARRLRLLPTEHGADVVLLLPPNDGVFTRTRSVAGVPHVALSQLALDCLSGNGRMPAEGEAVVEYMAKDEQRWRRPHLPDPHTTAGAAMDKTSLGGAGAADRNEP